MRHGALACLVVVALYGVVHCQNADAKQCKLDSSKIDLTQIASGKTFEINENFNGFRTLYKWTLDLCTPLPQRGACNTGYYIHGEYMQNNDRCYEQLGESSTVPTAEVDTTQGVVTMHYVTQASSPKNAYVVLECDPNMEPNTIEPSGDVMYSSTSNPYTQNYRFFFKSKCACSGGCYSGGGIGGWLFIIFLLVGIVLYVGIGMGWNHRKGLRGIELIPHLAFWKDLPALVKEGVLFSVEKIKGCVNRKGFTQV